MTSATHHLRWMVDTRLLCMNLQTIFLFCKYKMIIFKRLTNQSNEAVSELRATVDIIDRPCILHELQPLQRKSVRACRYMFEYDCMYQ